MQLFSLVKFLKFNKSASGLGVEEERKVTLKKVHPLFKSYQTSEDRRTSDGFKFKSKNSHIVEFLGLC